nr:DUF2274 domain-containing protein [Pseudomonas aeruginosa]
MRQGPLPKTESIKLTFACPASLKADLDHYAALHAQTYGEAVDAITLLPIYWMPPSHLGYDDEVSPPPTAI